MKAWRNAFESDWPRSSVTERRQKSIPEEYRSNSASQEAIALVDLMIEPRAKM
jgi:hypothetical protein